MQSYTILFHVELFYFIHATMAINNDITYFKSKSHFVNFIKMLLRDNHKVLDFNLQDQKDVEQIYEQSIDKNNMHFLKLLDFWNPAMYLTYRIRFLNDADFREVLGYIKFLTDELIFNEFSCKKPLLHEFKLPERYTDSYTRIVHSEIIENEHYTQMCEQARKATYKKCGVYKLFDKDKNLIYIGKSINLADRIISSVNERKAFYFSYIVCKKQCHANILEPYLIAILDPILNSEHKTNDKPDFEIPIPKESRVFKVKKKRYAE